MRRDMHRSSTLTILIYLLLAAALALPSSRWAVKADSAVTLRSTSTSTNGAGSTSLVLPLPAGTQAGDVLLTQVVINSTSSVITPPAGWNLILTTKSTSSVELATFYKAASDSEPAAYIFTFGASQPATGAISSFAGGD